MLTRNGVALLIAGFIAGTVFKNCYPRPDVDSKLSSIDKRISTLIELAVNRDTQIPPRPRSEVGAIVFASVSSDVVPQTSLFSVDLDIPSDASAVSVPAFCIFLTGDRRGMTARLKEVTRQARNGESETVLRVYEMPMPPEEGDKVLILLPAL